MDSASSDHTATRAKLALSGRQGSAAGVTAIGAVVFWAGYRDGLYDVSLWAEGAIVLWWSLLLGFALGILPRRRVTGPELAVVGFLAAFVALAGLSALWAPSAEAAFLAFDRGLLYLGALILVVAACTASARVLVVGGVEIAITAIAMLALISRVFPALGLGKNALVFLPDAQSRLSYPVGYWNGLAILVGLAFPLLLRSAIDSSSRIRRAAAMAAFPSLAAVVYLASSRTGAVTSAIGIIAFVALARRRQQALGAALISVGASVTAVALIAQQHQLVDAPLQGGAVDHQGRIAAVILILTGVAAALAHGVLGRVLRPIGIGQRARVGLVASIVLVVVAVSVLAHPTRHWQAFTTPPSVVAAADYHASHFLSTNGNWRWQYWMSALDEFRAHPLGGGGASSFESWWTRHETTAGFIGNAHSLFFETLAEFGAAGGLLLAGLLGFGALLAARRALAASPFLRETAAATTAASIAFSVAVGVDWMWELPIVALVGLVLLGLAIGDSQVEDGQPRARSGLSRTARISIAVVALVVIAAEADLLATTLKLRASQRAVARGDLSAAHADASDARAFAPWAASPYLQLALIDEQRGRLGQAESSIGKALTRDTGDWRIALIATRIETYHGDIAEARRSLDRARVLNPRFRAVAPG